MTCENKPLNGTAYRRPLAVPLSGPPKMRDVPEAIDEAFYAGTRTEEVPFAINDSVDVVDGRHSGKGGAVISIESIRPDVTGRVELGEDGTDVIVPVSALRHHETTG